VSEVIKLLYLKISLWEGGSSYSHVSTVCFLWHDFKFFWLCLFQIISV